MTAILGVKKKKATAWKKKHFMCRSSLIYKQLNYGIRQNYLSMSVFDDRFTTSYTVTLTQHKPPAPMENA